MAELVPRDLASHVNLGDIPSRRATIEQQLAAIKGECDPTVFNENVRFVKAIEMSLTQLPRAGDHLQNMQPALEHSVFALVAGRRRTLSRTLESNDEIDEPLLVGGC
eukprot:SAG22_NODE_14284_length_379_cov_0.739286_1_plen_106_part_10